MVLGIVIKSAGIASFILLISAASTGVYLRKLKLKIIHHKIIAVTSIAAAVIHFAAVIITQYFI